MAMLPLPVNKYDDGRTKQAFKEQCDINKILKKAQKVGSLSHFEKHGAYYGDFADFDFEEAQFALARATSMFEELPSQVRKDFGNNPGKFFEFVNAPENAGKIRDLLPAIAEPGTHPAVVSQAAKAAVASSEAASQPQAGVSSPPEAQPASAPAASEGG